MSDSLSIVADQQINRVAETFSCFGDVQLVDGRSITRNMLAKTDVLLVRSVTKVNESLLKDTPVRFVGSATSGIDHVDLDYLKHAGITFRHAPGSNARSVAEYVLSSLFVIAEQNEFSLADKTIGIIGCGQVGSRVKNFMQSLGVKCLLNDPPRALSDNDEPWLDLEQLYSADIISLHVPLTKEGGHPTLNLVDKDFLSQLKPEVILINTSRGEVVNETDLLEFKHNNPAATLVLDVWRNEPEINIDLLKLTAIATPHIAGYSYDGKLKATKMLYDRLSGFIDKKVNRKEGSNVEKDRHNPELFVEGNSPGFAVLQAYDVRSDAIALRDMMNIPETQRSAYFDSLRKNYPIRREFGYFTLLTADTNAEEIQHLQQLGFNLQAI